MKPEGFILEAKLETGSYKGAVIQGTYDGLDALAQWVLLLKEMALDTIIKCVALIKGKMLWASSINRSGKKK